MRIAGAFSDSIAFLMWILQKYIHQILIRNVVYSIRGGGDLYFRLDIIRVKGLSKYTLNTYFSCMKIDPKYVFLHVFFLICPLCPFQNLSIWPKTHPFFFNFARFCIPKRCTRVHCLVLKNNPNYVNFFYADDIQLQIQVALPGQHHKIFM